MLMLDALWTYIDPMVFSITLVLGLLYAYLMVPSPQVVMRHPTPNNTSTTYRDDAGVCYKYKSEEVKCPTKTHQIPLSSE